MGCSCEQNNEEYIINKKELSKLKSICQKEYFSYLNFILKLKGYLNSSQFIERNSNSDINENKIDNNANTKIEFYLIPYKWFEDWEKWVKNIIVKNEIKSFKTKFKYKNFKNKEKFHFLLMLEENWIKIYINSMYNINEEFITKEGLICNNLIILEYDSSLGEKNGIEIFFFEKDEDLFLTNLLFSFEKCDDSKSELNNLLTILKSSPIYEILGNMHYDQSQLEFIEPKKKIIIYNKTRVKNEEIIAFRKNQYELFLETRNKTEKEIIEDENENNDMIIQETTLIKINHHNTRDIKTNLKNESQAISRASTIMNPSHPYMMISSSSNNNQIQKMKHKKKDDIFMEELKNDSDKDNLEEKKLSDKLLLNNKLKRISRKKKIGNSSVFNNSNPNELEITEIIENKINESLLISILFCLFNIYPLREFICKNKESQIESTRFYSSFSKIMLYLSENMYRSNNSIDLEKTINIKSYLIENCEEYNYQKFSEIIKKELGKNLISKIINILHVDINQKFKDYFSVEINQKKQDQKYNEFINNISKIHNSIFFDLFFGIKNIKKICQNCKCDLSTYKIISVFDISIDKIKKYLTKKEISRQKTNKEEPSILSIEECVSYLLKEQNEDKIFKCPFCDNNSNYNKLKEICKYPEYTIFYINNSYQENIRINFRKNIILSNNTYELIGIISQYFNNNKKKYIAFCQDIIDKKWFKYDEKTISQIDISKEKDNIIDPIALFYQEIK